MIAEAVAHSPAVTREPRHDVSVLAGYDEALQVGPWARRQGIAMLGAEYGTDVTLRLGAGADMLEKVCRTAAEFSGGEVLTETHRASYVDLE